MPDNYHIFGIPCICLVQCTFLHLFLREDITDVVEALLVAGANPNCVSAQEKRPLDMAQSSKCIRLLLVYGANPTSIYEACRTYLPSSCPTTPEEPSVKVFIVGDSGAGKSTLTESLKKDIIGFSGFLARVNPVSAEKKTTGIMPHKISSSTMGKFQVYDLAGDKEFHSSHDAIISTSLSGSSSAVFLLVVDLRPAPDDISRTIHYWLDFLRSKLPPNCPKPHLTIVGSHFDQMLQSEFRVKMEKFASIQEKAQSCGFEVKEIITINCLIAKSDGMTKLRHSLSASYESLRPQAAMTFRTHCFHILLVSLSKEKHAIQLSAVLESCKEQPGHDVYKFLPQTPKALCTICDELSERSHILFFKNETKLENSWIVIDQATLLNRVNGTVFASKESKKYRELSTSTGIVPFSRIAAEFGDIDPTMITQFLIHLQFCMEIQHDALEMIQHTTAFDPNGGRKKEGEERRERGKEGGREEDEPAEKYFLFPNLVRDSIPDDVWVPDKKFSHYSGWQVECSNPGEFFTPRFLQLLLLRISFRYALAPSPEEVSTDHPAIQRRCKLWNSGIFWRNRNLTSALVEVADHSTRVTILVRCQEQRKEDMTLLRSALVQEVVDIRDQVCPNVSIKEFILHPRAAATHPVKATSEEVVNGSELAVAIAKREPGCFNTSDEDVPISEFLLYDPYSSGQQCKQELEQLIKRYSDHIKAVSNCCVPGGLFLDYLVIILHV